MGLLIFRFDSPEPDSRLFAQMQRSVATLAATQTEIWCLRMPLISGTAPYRLRTQTHQKQMTNASTLSGIGS